MDSRIDDVYLAGLAVRHISIHHGFAEHDAAMLELAVVEAINNVIEHAYGGCDENTVKLRIGALPGEIVFEIVDHGIPVQGSWHTGTEPEIGNMRPTLDEGGRGKFLIRQVADEVSYNANHDGQNVLTLIKKLQ